MSGTIVVSGAIANKHRNGGAIWTRLNWLLGFRALGFRVVFVEQIAASTCVDEAGRPASFRESANLATFRAIAERFGFPGTLFLDDGSDIDGLPLDALNDLAANAELLVNISGHLRYRPLFERFQRKAYIDLDPGFTQFWHASRIPGAHLDEHDAYYTVGANIGTPDCAIPCNGIDWRPVRQPAVLEYWPVCRSGDPSRFTTVATLRGPFGPIDADGRTFGLKVHQLRRFVTMPHDVGATFEIALDAHPADGRDVDALVSHGWTVVDPTVAVGDPDAFRRYVQCSGAEFSVAQGIYVETASGWFSDRTVRYLASGKPAVVQDTGFSDAYPVGQGLIAFRSVEDAVAGARNVLAHYDAHARAARQIAEEYFEATQVLGRLAEELELRP